MTINCPMCGEAMRFHSGAVDNPIGEDNTTSLEWDEDICPVDEVVVYWIVDKVVESFVLEAYEMET